MSLTNSEQISIVKEAAEKIRQNYVFPEVAEEIIAHLNKIYVDNTEGESESATFATPGAFCEQLTTDLQKINGDKHLRMNYRAYSENEPKVLYDSPEWQAEYLLECQLNNFNIVRLERLAGNVGYFKLNGFEDAYIAGDRICQAMNFLSHTYALIIDLRDNRGGDPGTVALLCSYFFGIEPVHLNDMYARNDNSIQQFWTNPYVPGLRYGQKPLFILTSSKTFSAAEEFSYNMKNLKRATLVGEVTRGGANPKSVFVINHKYHLSVPVARSINPITKTNWEGVGVAPDIEIEAGQALEKAWQLALAAVKTTLEGGELNLPERLRTELLGEIAAATAKQDS